jgi:pyruvate kinase
VGEYPVEAVATMRRICAEAEAYLKAVPRPAAGASPSLAGFVEPITEATVDAASLVARRLDAPLIVVATDSGRTALALSNRRPAAAVLALTRTEPVARSLAVCWGVTPVVQPEAVSLEKDMTFAIEWARSRRLVEPGQYVVLLRGQVPGEDRSRGVLVRQVS